MRSNLRILVVLIPAFSLALLAAGLMGSGGGISFTSQGEAALALAH